MGAWRDAPKSMGCHAQGCSRAPSQAELWVRHCLTCSGTMRMGGGGTERSQLPPDRRESVPSGTVSPFGQPDVKVSPLRAQVWPTNPSPICDSVSLLCVEVMMEKPSGRAEQIPGSPWAEVGYPAQAGAGSIPGLQLGRGRWQGWGQGDRWMVNQSNASTHVQRPL